MLAEKRRNRKRPYTSIGYTTGDLNHNINMFNRAMGTGGIGCENASSEGSCGGLTEAKRYVRRYYIRPQNIFCSNKAEILKALIDLDDANCSVYTLNNLGDEKDVTKLMNSDIIYYYDNGILYDKNKVKVMDYDLSIKREEDRKHFADVDKASEKDFKNAYEDRMTDATELEEAVSNNPFNLDFEDVDVFGYSLNESKVNICCLCGEPYTGYGNDPWPLKDEGRCCNGCNTSLVIPERLKRYKQGEY